MSSRLKGLLFENLHETLPKIETRIDRIKQECYNIEYELGERITWTMRVRAT